MTQRAEAILRHAWAVRQAAWKVHRCFSPYYPAIREEALSNALCTEVSVLLRTSSVVREAPVRLTFTPTGSRTPVVCGNGRADLVVTTAVQDEAPVITVIEVKRDAIKTGAAQAKMYRDFLGATGAFVIVFGRRCPTVIPIPSRGDRPS